MHGMLRAPRTALAGVSCGILQYVPDGSGAMLVSAGDRHCDAGMKPVRHGGGWLIASAEVERGLVRERQRRRLGDRTAPCGSITSTCSRPLWYAPEQAGDDLEVRQRLRQRLSDAAEHLVDLLERSAPPWTARFFSCGSCWAVWAAKMFRLCTHARCRHPSRPGCPAAARVAAMMSLMSADVGLEVAGERLRRVDQPVQRRAQPAHRLRRLVEQCGDLVFRQRRQARGPAVSSAGPISSGTVPLVMVCPGEKNLPGLPARHQVQILLTDRRHRMHFRDRVDRDLVATVDAHRRFGALLRSAPRR